MATGTPRFTIGRALGDSLKIYGRNFIAFGLVALAIRLLLLLVPDGQTAGVMTSASRINWLGATLSMVAAVVAGGVTSAVVIFPTIQNLRGQRAVVSDFWRSISSLPAIIVAGALLSLPSFASLIIRGLFPGNPVVFGIGALVMGVVVLVLLLMWWLSAPAIAVEQIGAWHRLKRSRYLLGGQRWRVLGLLVIMGVSSSAIGVAIALLAGLRLTDPGTLASLRSMTPAGIAVFIVGALVSTFDGVLVTVSYYYLRVEKEGAIAEDLVQVFD